MVAELREDRHGLAEPPRPISGECAAHQQVQSREVAVLLPDVEGEPGDRYGEARAGQKAEGERKADGLLPRKPPTQKGAQTVARSGGAEGAHRESSRHPVDPTSAGRLKAVEEQ
jgi:hypothetical protein